MQNSLPSRSKRNQSYGSSLSLATEGAVAEATGGISDLGDKEAVAAEAAVTGTDIQLISATTNKINKTRSINNEGDLEDIKVQTCVPNRITQRIIIIQEHTRAGLPNPIHGGTDAHFTGQGGKIRGPRRGRPPQKVESVGPEWPSRGDPRQLPWFLQQKLHYPQKGSGGMATHFRPSPAQHIRAALQEESPWVILHIAYDQTQRFTICVRCKGRLLQRTHPPRAQVLLPLPRGQGNLSIKPLAYGLRRERSRVQSLAESVFTDSKSTLPKSQHFFVCRRLFTNPTSLCEGQSGRDPPRHPQNLANIGGPAEETKVYLVEQESRVPRLRRLLGFIDPHNTEKEGKVHKEADKTDPQERSTRKDEAQACRNNYRHDHRALTGSPSREAARRCVVPASKRPGDQRRMGIKPSGEATRIGRGRIAALVGLPRDLQGAPPSASIQAPRSYPMRIRRQRQHDRVRKLVGFRNAGGVKRTLKKGKTYLNQREGNVGRSPSNRALHDQTRPPEFQDRQQDGGVRDQQVEDQFGGDETSAAPPIHLVPRQQSTDNRYIHTHVSERSGGQSLQRFTDNDGGSGGNGSPAQQLRPDTKESEVENALHGSERSTSYLLAAPETGMARSSVQPGRQHPPRLRAPVPHKPSEEVAVRIPKPSPSPGGAGDYKQEKAHSSGNLTLLAGGPLVSHSRNALRKQPPDTATVSGKTMEPAEKVLSALAMDFCTAIRLEEEKNELPEAARLTLRLSKGTQERYNNGWKRIRRLVSESPHILRETPKNSSEAKILAHLLSALASTLKSEGKSSSAYGMAASAVSHYLQAKDPSPGTIVRNTAKAFRRLRPPVAKNDVVPDLHDILDKVAGMFHSDNEKDMRDHLAFLLMCLTGRRAADICRVWRHRYSLRMVLVKLDTPQWVREHRSEAGDILRDLGYLPDTIGDREFIQVELRAYLGKTCQTTGTRYDPWVTLTENRFYLPLCPIYALARYLQKTRRYNIKTELSYDNNTTIKYITAPDGSEEIKAKPLLISANGKLRTGLQATTLRSRVQKGLFIPLGIPNTPHSLRAAVTSYKAAYGVPIHVVKRCGNWSANDAFEKHYFRVVPTPIDKRRLHDVTLHDWTIARAYHLTTLALGPLSPDEVPDTANDEAIAAAFSASSSRRRSLRR